MALTKNVGRQEVIAARQVVLLGTGGDVLTQVATGVIDLPVGAVVVGGSLNVSDATSASVKLALGDSGSASRYATNVAADSVALTALTLTGYQYTTADTLILTTSGADPAAVGSVEIVVLYIVNKRAMFSQG